MHPRNRPLPFGAKSHSLWSYEGFCWNLLKTMMSTWNAKEVKDKGGVVEFVRFDYPTKSYTFFVSTPTRTVRPNLLCGKTSDIIVEEGRRMMVVFSKRRITVFQLTEAVMAGADPLLGFEIEKPVRVLDGWKPQPKNKPPVVNLYPYVRDFFRASTEVRKQMCLKYPNRVSELKSVAQELLTR